LVRKQVQAENPLYTYFFDAGDLMQGTPTSTILHGEPLIALHNAIGADAMTIETMSLTGVWMC